MNRNYRAEEAFALWCSSGRYQTEKFTAFKARCFAGEVPGFSLVEEPVSDTVHGDAEAQPASERRDGSRRRLPTSPGPAVEQPGTSDGGTTGEGREVTAPDREDADDPESSQGDGLSLFG